MVLTKTRKFILLFTCCLVLLFARGGLVFADEENTDLSNKASISLCLRDPVDDSVIDAARFSLYQVAVPAGVDGEEAFLYTPDFAACGIELGFEEAELLAGRLAAYAGYHQLEAADQKTSEAGWLCFSALPEGLYLIVQEGGVAGYYAASPFLVSLPLLMADGSLTYEPEAFPKIERMAVPEPPVSQETEPEPTLAEVTDPEPETETSAPPETEPAPQAGKTDPPDPDEPRLIQTGQVNWPIPLLATAGFLLFTYGWPAYRGKKDKVEAAGEAVGEEDGAEGDDEEG